MENLSKMDVESSLKYLNSTSSGLSSYEAKSRLLQINKRKEKIKKNHFLSEFFKQFADLMIIILLIASAVSIIIGLMEGTTSELIDGVLILLIVILNAIMGAMQERKAEKSLLLLKKITEPTAKVFRDGVLKTLNTKLLVRGDVVLLEAGSIIPADVRLIESVCLKIDESSLTGESVPASKEASLVYHRDVAKNDRQNIAYLGTIVTTGHGKGIVYATADETEIGKVSKNIKQYKAEQTPLQKNLKEVGKILTYLVLLIATITFLLEVAIDPSNMMEAFLTSVAIAVAAIPESLPAVITIIMSIGVSRLSQEKAIVKRLSSVETLGCCDIIASDKTGTITENRMSVEMVYTESKFYNHDVKNINNIEILSKICTFCSNFEENNKKIEGDPMEVALVNFAKINNPKVLEQKKSSKKIAEIPFDFEGKFMTTTYEVEGVKIEFLKGANEEVIKRCDFILDGNVRRLDGETATKIENAVSTMGKEAMRTISLAYRTNFGEGFIFVASLGMLDPPRKEVFEAVKKCKKAGMRPIMITGDHKETALKIALLTGIAESDDQIMTGLEIDNMTEKELLSKVENINVFARVTSDHKSRLVEILKKNGHVVAMTGDGVNDAPSLKRADIGIGMGKNGSDIAKEVADVIIADDNFATIVIAVKEGRKIYSNIQKTIKFLFSANMAEIMSLFLATIIFPQLSFLLPVQILFTNLITDCLPALALGFENCEEDQMQEKPRDVKRGLFCKGTLVSIIYHGVLQTLFTLVSYILGLKLYDESTAITMAFYTLNLIQFFYLFSARTTDYCFKSNPFKNKFMTLAYVFCFGLIGILVFTPLGSILKLCEISIYAWIIIIFECILMLILSEMYKFVSKKLKNKLKFIKN